MEITQFEDRELSHYSYAILSGSEVVFIDPARNIQPYLDFAQKHNAKILAVIETHPHADFVSGHLEIHNLTGAKIYCSRLCKATYSHQFYDEGDIIEFGKIKLKALNTPGHSPDGISIILEHNGIDNAVFTGDTLFVGDCGRPDLRDDGKNASAVKEELAKAMYHTLRNKFFPLADNVIVYPAHGAGTLCGKSLSDEPSSTIGKQKLENWCLQDMTLDAFVQAITEDQPFVPKYFSFDVKLNLEGAESMDTAIQKVPKRRRVDTIEESLAIDKSIVVIDTRPADAFKDGHLANSINIMADGKFETWLGSIVAPDEHFYLAVESEESMAKLLARVAKIGYETLIKEAIIVSQGEIRSEVIDLVDFKMNPADYTIIDIRNEKEIIEEPFFKEAINIPLPNLRDRLAEIPSNKPIVVHCAGGYRSAAGSSIIERSFLEIPVYDLSTSIDEFRK